MFEGIFLLDTQFTFLYTKGRQKKNIFVHEWSNLPPCLSYTGRWFEEEIFLFFEDNSALRRGANVGGALLSKRRWWCPSLLESDDVTRAKTAKGLSSSSYSQQLECAQSSCQRQNQQTLFISV